MLANRWGKSLTYWCKHLNIFIARGIESSLGCRSQYDTTFAWITIVMTISWEKVTHETRFARVEWTMTMFAIMHITFVVSTISACWHNDYKNEVEKTWVCSLKTWNPTSLAMEAKESQIASCLATHLPSWTKRKRCIKLLNL
jgi:hypothetical protein